MNKLKVFTKQNETDKVIFASFGALFGITTLALLSLTALSAAATVVVGGCERASAGDACTSSASATASVNVNSACSMSTSSSGSYSANMNPGNSAEIAGSTLNLTCNDPNTYALYSVGFTGNNEGSNVLASSEGSQYNIATGTATTGGTSAWAMKVNSESANYTAENSYNTYQNVPATPTKVASFSSATGTFDATVTTSYQVYAAAAQAAGDYTGKVKYIMVHPSVSDVYTVTYDANGGEVSPSSALGGTVTLPTATRSGYALTGWYTAASGGTKVGPAGANYTATADITLHAQWEERSDLFAISTMQQMTPEICEGTTTPLASATALDTDGSHAGDNTYVPSTTLTDTRGGSYVVRKLADGNCWMVQNLNLSLSTSTTLTNENTDLNSKTTWTPEVATSSSVPGNSNNPTSYTRGNKWCSGTASGSGQTCNTTDTGDQTNHVGILYNWYAATAMSGTAAMASSDATNTTDAEDSICPKGWRLPTGGTSNKTNTNGQLYSFNNLTATTYSIASDAAGSVKMRSNPLSFILSGGYGNGSLGLEGSDGYYWSSSAYTSSTYAYNLNFDNSGVKPQDFNNKQSGRSVRCVAR